MVRKVTIEDVNKALTITTMCGAFIGGSFIVNSEEANDIDVVIGSSEYGSIKKTYTFLEDFEPSLVEQEVSTEYDHIYELIATYKYKGVNLLVVRDEFIAAYKGAVVEMMNNPDEYQTREARIELHQRYKQVIRDMLKGEL